MKSKLLAIILMLNVMGWAQSSNPAPAPEQKSAPAEAKPGCPCCAKTADMHDHAAMHKDMQACVQSKDGKEAMDCCAGKNSKDAMSCCSSKDGKDAMACRPDKEANATAKDGKAASCCSAGKGEGKGMSCCAPKGGKSAEGCCGGNSCGKHDHAEHATPGN